MVLGTGRSEGGTLRRRERERVEGQEPVKGELSEDVLMFQPDGPLMTMCLLHRGTWRLSDEGRPG